MTAKISNFELTTPVNWVQFEIKDEELKVYLDAQLLEKALKGGFYGALAGVCIECIVNPHKKLAEKLAEGAVTGFIGGALTATVMRSHEVYSENIGIKKRNQENEKHLKDTSTGV